MKRFFCLLFLLGAGLLLGAQTRNYNDNASGTFIFGLDSYFYGENGALDFDADGKACRVSVSAAEVDVNGTRLENGGDVVVGIHDFTGNHIPELVVARREGSALGVKVYTLRGGSWQVIGSMKVPDSGKEIRVFRQVISIRRGEVLCSWTCHGEKFDYKASDGSLEP